jgi:hypothetical protein
MNVHANTLVTADYLDNYAEPSKILPFIPASQASLTINGKTITRRHAKQLRQAASSPRRTCNQAAHGQALTTPGNRILHPSFGCRLLVPQ